MSFFLFPGRYQMIRYFLAFIWSSILLLVSVCLTLAFPHLIINNFLFLFFIFQLFFFFFFFFFYSFFFLLFYWCLFFLIIFISSLISSSSTKSETCSSGGLGASYCLCSSIFFPASLSSPWIAILLLVITTLHSSLRFFSVLAVKLLDDLSANCFASCPT